MILTITLNASMDKKYEINSLLYGDINRIRNCKNSAGGKGINVARVINILGGKQIASGIVGGNVGSYILDELDKGNIQHDFYNIDSESRVCINLINQEDGSQTELLEKGPEISETERKAFLDKYTELLERIDFIVMSGSAPKGFQADIYKQLIEIANSKGIKCFLDTSGEYLKEGIQAKPYVIKPNISELESYANKKLNKKKEIIGVAKSIIHNGVNIVLVSCGKDGLICVTKKEAFQIKAPLIDVVNTVGSGDSSVAGFAYEIQNGTDLYEACKMAVACGSANALETQTGYVNPSKVKDLIKDLKIEKLKL